MNQLLIAVCLMPIMMWMGVGTIWIASKLFKNPKIPFTFKNSMIPEITYLPILAFWGSGLILFCFAFLLCPNETKDCSGLICKITPVDKFNTAVKFAVVFGLVTEYVISLVLTLKYFVVKR